MKLTHNVDDYGYNDDGQLEKTTPFPYEQVGKVVDDASHELTPAELVEMRRECSRLTTEEREAAMSMFRMLVRWLWQSGMTNPNGLLIRSVIVCWVFLEEVQQFNLTGIAHKFDRDKQSIGRWMPRFKKAFPMIKTPHMKNEPTTKKGKKQ
jgi:hypothetical protein